VRGELSWHSLPTVPSVSLYPPGSTPSRFPPHPRSAHSDRGDADREDRCGPFSDALASLLRRGGYGQDGC
jgi:hypothetical protein